ncbi:MAG: hypothetical protein Q7S21_01335 [archaeon]|nr:hypothetical protein [archaeon]
MPPHKKIPGARSSASKVLHGRTLKNVRRIKGDHDHTTSMALFWARKVSRKPKYAVEVYRRLADEHLLGKIESKRILLRQLIHYPSYHGVPRYEARITYDLLLRYLNEEIEYLQGSSADFSAHFRTGSVKELARFVREKFLQKNAEKNKVWLRYILELRKLLLKRGNRRFIEEEIQKETKAK